MTKPDNYFADAYGLTPTHSEVLAALPFVTPGKALDLGCGNGRNSLFLSQQGFDVTAWDHNPAILARLEQIAAQEGITTIHTEQRDLNQTRFNGGYTFVLSTVVMMFLQPQTIPQLIADMQASTLKNGHNLIVAAMSTDDYPCPLDFPFTFKSGELSHYYRNWHILRYNEHIGQLHKRDEHGNRISCRFATLLAQKASL
ncbi:tellurite resistance methyltransferase TehB [Candidatus Pantoea persica]|uniref:tellurite resistance methyltransferase TehB n=1 Tax=Candidatus Pantoea persica TaxID=2518128 RepID=UPI00215D6A2B|nr:tellurite resistance methyltransferase TehB [Candidatus Pantoea persica]MBA2817169.1 Tellurite methyltransferase [Candidatus Pantoea persica]